MALHTWAETARSWPPARYSFQSLGRAYTMMSEQEWQGAPLRQILAAETSAFADRVSVDEIDLLVRQKAAQSFALILHELTTNAFSVPARPSQCELERRPGKPSWPVRPVLGGDGWARGARTGYGRKIIENTMRRIGRHQIETGSFTKGRPPRIPLRRQVELSESRNCKRP